MRDILGKPISDIPLNILNQMVNKEVAMSLRKFKMNAGQKSPARRSKSRGTDTTKNDSFVRETNESAGSLSFLKRQLRELEGAAADRTSMLKMLLIRCDQTNQDLMRIKH